LLITPSKPYQNMKKPILALTLLIGAGLTASHADTFGTGSNKFTLNFQTIGNPGNAADTTGYGAVDYTYRIGTYAISQNQIDAAVASGLANVTAGAWNGNQPAANMTWYESAAFVNWLNTSKGFQPAYNLTWSGSTWTMALWTATDNGYDANNLYRNSQAKYFLPSENEFYKAAYGKSDGSGYYFYPTASDTAPTIVASGTSPNTAVYNQIYEQGPASVYEAGGLSSYGTMGQGGNVFGWEESAYSGSNIDPSADRTFRGGGWWTDNGPLQSSQRYYYYIYLSPDYEYGDLGFRVASVDGIPEPSTYALMGLGTIALIVAYRRRIGCVATAGLAKVA
jgi:formylglycine-generating enzyme required for sulfatase activity